MTNQDFYLKIVEIVRSHMYAMSDLLRSQLAQAGLTTEANPAIWWNESGLIVGSVSVWVEADRARDSIDGVFTVKLSDARLTIAADVCLSSGTIIAELFEQDSYASAREELEGIVEAAIRVAEPRMVSTIVSAVRAQA